MSRRLTAKLTANRRDNRGSRRTALDGYIRRELRRCRGRRLAGAAYESGTPTDQTALVSAQVDLALLEAQQANQMRPPLHGTAARDSGRVIASTLGWSAELDDLLLREHGVLPEVQDFHERRTVLRRLVSRGPAGGETPEAGWRPHPID